MSPSTAPKKAATPVLKPALPPLTIEYPSLDGYMTDGDKYIQALVFGDPGTGKTPWSAQWPDTLHLMADRNGENSLVITRSPFVRVRSRQDMERALTAAELHVASGRIKTVVLDTISVYSRHVAQEILTAAGLASMDDFRQWGELTSEITRTLHRLQNLNCNVIVLCHTKGKFESKTGELDPDIQGGAKGDLPKEFPYIGHLTALEVMAEGGKDKKIVRKIAWRSSAQLPFMRSPSNILPPSTDVHFRKSDYEQIIEAIQAGATKLAARFEKEDAPAELEMAPAELLVASPESPSGAVPAIDPSKVPAARKPAAKKAAAKPAAKSAAALPATAAPVDDAPVDDVPIEEPPVEEPPVADPADPATWKGATPEEAQANVEQVLGGKVISEVVDIPTLIESVTTADALTDLWRQHKDIWLPEYSELAKARRAAL